MFRHIVVRGAAGGLTLTSRDHSNNSPDGLVRRISILNNIFDDINNTWGGSGSGNFMYVTHGPKDVTTDHNTIIQGRTPLEVDSNNQTYPLTNFKFRNNIMAHNTYGVRSTNGTGNPVFNLYFTDPGHQFIANILMGGNPNNYTAR